MAVENVASGHDGPLPWRPILALCACNVAHFYAVCSLFSYGGIMSADLGWVKDRDNAGNVAGFLQSSNVLGRIPTASLWGFFGSRFGLIRGLCISMGSLVIGGILFGLCTDKIPAVAIRFIFLGMGSGWPTLLAPCVIEIGGVERQTEVIGIVFAAGTFIQLLGPAVGGWTYGTIPRFPAAIPSMIGSAFGLFAVVVLRCWMPSMGCPAKLALPVDTDSQRGALEVICTRPLPLLIFLRFMQGCMHFSFFEVVPLWAISSESLGGLALSEDDLGIVLSCSALGSGLFMVRAMPRLIQHVGLRWSGILSNAIAAASIVAVPFSPGPAYLVFLHVVANSALTMLAATYLASINNVVPSDQRAVVNGVCVTFEALGKGIGPMGSSVAFAWTLKSFGRGGHSMVFLCMGVMHVLLLFGTACLPQAVHGDGVAKANNSPAAKTSLESCTLAPSTFGALDVSVLDAKAKGAKLTSGKRRGYASVSGGRADDDVEAAAEGLELQLAPDKAGIAADVWPEKKACKPREAAEEISEHAPLAQCVVDAGLLRKELGAEGSNV